MVKYILFEEHRLQKTNNRFVITFIASKPEIMIRKKGKARDR